MGTTIKNKQALAILAMGALIGSAQAQSQVQVNLPATYAQNAVLGKNGLPNDVVGSPYFIETFNYGSVIVEDKESYKALMRYNAYSDEIEMKNNDSSITALMKRDYIRASFNNQTFGIFTYEEEGGERKGYFVVLYETKNFTLLKRKKKLLKEGRQATSSYSNDTPPSFDDIEKCYLQIDGNKAISLRLKKKDVISALPDALRSKAEVYIKQNKTKLKTEKEVIMLLNHLSSS
jgi:hypothetical protein